MRNYQLNGALALKSNYSERLRCEIRGEVEIQEKDSRTYAIFRDGNSHRLSDGRARPDRPPNGCQEKIRPKEIRGVQEGQARSAVDPIGSFAIDGARRDSDGNSAQVTLAFRGE